ncbi:recombinase family protein [Anaerotignum sp.]|uniref:recombinase family protein n=1 Tax=Anaerotignum sp. TaxID=2039241 RepID=UPI0028A9F776|nr:recombinase family protein [Anaerotignum sp.]
MIFGYCRISTSKQNIERQLRNIREAFPMADIKQEVYTGTKILNRPEWNKLLKKVKAGDTIVFDSVSRMSRNADEGFTTYMDLYNKNINLIFLKEQTINTGSYKSLADGQIKLSVSTNDTDTDELVNDILSVVSKYVSKLAEKQIRLAFEQSEKEVVDLHQRTKEGIETARLSGKQIGLPEGTKLTTKKSIAAKEQIKKHNNTFGGSLTNEETWKLIGISKTAFYKYKNELLEEMNK